MHWPVVAVPLAHAVGQSLATSLWFWLQVHLLRLPPPVLIGVGTRHVDSSWLAIAYLRRPGITNHHRQDAFLS